MRAPILVPIALLGAALVPVDGTATHAVQPGERAPAAAKLIQAATPIPLEAVLRLIEERYPGRALGAQLVDHGGRQVYRIKWMGDDGRVHEIVADVASGEILQVR
jgi:uncharacterized membrane protein YkoI